jgi:uncharacterized membrane protein
MTDQAPPPQDPGGQPGPSAAQAGPAVIPPPAPSPQVQPPPRAARDSRTGTVVAGVIGLIFIGLGVYFFLRETLDIALPSLGQLWPVVLILVGLAILYAGVRRTNT